MCRLVDDVEPGQTVDGAGVEQVWVVDFEAGRQRVVDDQPCCLGGVGADAQQHQQPDALLHLGRIDAATVEVVVGALNDIAVAARGPGQLSYSSGAPAANIGLQALENFNYQSLSGTLDYGSDGGYTIGVELLGANPDLYGGYPIRFKLNLGGAMPALFRSLFVTGDFDKAIIEQLRSDDLKVEP